VPCQSTKSVSTHTINTKTDECNTSKIIIDSTNCSNVSISMTPTPNDDYVGYISVPLLLVIGICGNTMTIIVMRNAQFRSTTFSLILKVLALSDMLLIVLLPFNKVFVRRLLGADIRAISSTACKIYFFFFRSSKMTSSWFVVFLALERFLAVWFPLKVKEISSKRNTLLAIAIVYIFIFSFNGVWTFSSALVNNVCVPNLVIHGREGISEAFLLTGTILYFFIPAFLLAIITPLTTVKLFQQHKLRMRLTGGQLSTSNDILRTTVMLVGVTVAFLILVAPIAFAHLFAHFRNEHIFESKDPMMTIFRNISQLMEQTNYAINFFLYVLCNKSFRNRCLVVLGCRVYRNRQSTFRGVSSSEHVKSYSVTSLSIRNDT